MLLSFSVETFNGLVGHYDDVRHFGDKDLADMVPIINKFGDLFLKHGMEKHAALSLSHRHFMLNPGERKLARQPNQTTLQIKAVPEAEADGALPYLLLPVWKTKGSEASLVPLEYVIHEDKDQADLLRKDIDAVCNQEFLSKFLDLAMANSVNSVYGLTLLSRDTLTYEKTTHTTLEGSGQEPRSLVVRVVPKGGEENMRGEDVTTVAWAFSKDPKTGGVVPVSACSSLSHGDVGACWDHCYHCAHCSQHCVQFYHWRN